MKCKYDEKSGKLTIEIEVEKPFSPSKSGKTIIVASSHGGQTVDCKVNGVPLIVSLNAYLPN